ncbi:MAG: AMP-binding protein [Thermoanaerobaculia bacterium]|nr:AMP-binding protein [Thermoanaerobaculia bacterium]
MTFSVYAAALDAPEYPAVVWPDGRISTWKEVAGQVAATAHRLRQSFGSGSAPVAFSAENRPATVLTFWALWELGWTAVPLHARWSEPERTKFVARLGLERTISDTRLTAFEHLDPMDPPPPRPHAKESIAAWLATSGSTGEPKAVALSRRAFAAAAEASASRLGWRDGDRWLASLPFAHVGGLSVLTRCLEARKTVVMTPGSGSFSPKVLADWADRQGVTILSVVPAMFRRLLDERVVPPERLRALLLGGAAAPAPWIEEGLSAGWPLWCTYGLTEACSQVATGPAGELRGTPLLDGVEARTIDGALEIRGDVLFSGYEPSGPRLRSDSWFRTGDRARLDGKLLQVLGRADDMLITGGENVHPAEVESVLLEHPAIRAACVVGVEHDRWGQTVAAAIVGGRLGELELEAFFKDRLAGFRRPRRWRFVEELPTNALGKVDRQAVRRLFAVGLVDGSEPTVSKEKK